MSGVPGSNAGGGATASASDEKGGGGASELPSQPAVPGSFTIPIQPMASPRLHASSAGNLGLSSFGGQSPQKGPPLAEPQPPPLTIRRPRSSSDPSIQPLPSMAGRQPHEHHHPASPHPRHHGYGPPLTSSPRNLPLPAAGAAASAASAAATAAVAAAKSSRGGKSPNHTELSLQEQAILANIQVRPSGPVRGREGGSGGD